MSLVAPSRLDIRQFLKRSALLAGCADGVATELARSAQLRTVPDNCVLFHKDDRPDTLYFLLSGAIVLLVRTSDGREMVINETCPGEPIGELSVATGHPHTTDAVTRTPSELVAIPREHFVSLLDDEPRIARNLLDNVAGWVRSDVERESALAFLDAPARLALLLLKLDHDATAVGYLMLSQEELAQFVGVTRQTAARILGEWRRAGWIFTGRGRIALLNRGALRRVAEDVA